MKTKAITLEKITQYVLIFIISAIMTMIGNCINTVTDHCVCGKSSGMACSQNSRCTLDYHYRDSSGNAL